MVDRYTVKRTERSWTSRKDYVICDGKKEVLRLRNQDEADEVCAYLNKVHPKKKSRSKAKPKAVKKEDWIML